jgi:hypothetical protein
MNKNFVTKKEYQGGNQEFLEDVRNQKNSNRLTGLLSYKQRQTVTKSKKEKKACRFCA